MIIKGMEKISLVDFDGYVACTVFAAGCNFACPFCHNSPLVENSQNLPIISEKEVLDYLASRKKIIDAVCISGGEPTLYPTLPQFVGKIKSLGFKVKLDTNGTNFQMIKNLVCDNLLDYVAMDIKTCLEDYDKACGVRVDKDKIVETVDFLKGGSVDYEFRTTLIKQYHDENTIAKMGSLIKGAKRFFMQHFVYSSNCINAEMLSAVEKEEAEKFAQIMRKFVQNVYLRGF